MHHYNHTKLINHSVLTIGIIEIYLIVRKNHENEWSRKLLLFTNPPTCTCVYCLDWESPCLSNVNKTTHYPCRCNAWVDSQLILDKSTGLPMPCIKICHTGIIHSQVLSFYYTHTCNSTIIDCRLEIVYG